MSREYNTYLENHKENVAKGFKWIKDNLPHLLQELPDVDYEWQICMQHDASKTESDEYEAYDAYFYGGNRSFEVVDNFRHAWLKHIHRNPHHWQYWILVNDEPNEGMVVLDMPYNYIIEMICDWWAFSWKDENLTEIFGWYDSHKDHMKLSPKTRFNVEITLALIAKELDFDWPKEGGSE